ncbi:MAG: hypothetical protein LIO90_10345, partial [Bacteroidales bacterium]|nr:hypothetical protein [Bacteroidales bacterium]
METDPYIIPAALLDAITGKNASVPTLQEVEELERHYPYFTLPALQRLRNAPDGTLTDDERRSLRESVALNASDPTMLFRLIDPDGRQLQGFYPAEETNPTPTTDAAIDTFLEAYGKIDPQEQALLEKLIFNPVPDYATVLQREAAEAPAQEETPASEDRQDALLDAFLKKHAPKETPTPPAPSH